MQLVPSISVINGKLTRLFQGDFNKDVSYNDTPIDVAKKLEDHGVKKIHFLDLDGAKRGRAINLYILNSISGYTKLRINFTGGIHTDGDVLKAFEYGATSITAATIAISNQELFSNWLMSYGREKIALAADSLNGVIRIKGWQQGTEIELFEHISYFYDRGLKYLKTTDITKEGIMQGPAFDLYKKLIQEFPDLKIYASGGVRGMEDINQLADIGLYGVIFGKAYYEGKITLKDIEKYHAK